MMALTDDILAGVTDALTEVGKTATITRVTEGTWVDANDHSKGKIPTSASYTATVAVIDYTADMIDGTVVRQGDKMVAVSLGSVLDGDSDPVSNFVPTVDDKFVDSAGTWKIINVESSEVLGSIVFSMLQVRM